MRGELSLHEAEIKPNQQTNSPLTLLSIVIPARNEADCVAATIRNLYLELSKQAIRHEVVAVDDGSTDDTWEVLQNERANVPTLRPIQNPAPHGFGRAIISGLNAMNGDAVVIMMADDSDDSRDVVRYWFKLQEGYDCVFGSRFIRGGHVIGYPISKLILNRLANAFIRILFRHRLNDTTNAFKAYRRTVIDGVRPILSPHFNITVELPLKAIVRGYSWAVIPITWRNRPNGIGKLAIRKWVVDISSSASMSGWRSIFPTATIAKFLRVFDGLSGTGRRSGPNQQVRRSFSSTRFSSAAQKQRKIF